jgi:putative ABC transport system permease protein
MLALLPTNVRLALRSLNRHRLRTALTMLGIVIGVAAVLTMVALGTGARASVESEVGAAGTNLIFVQAGNFTRGGESVGITAGLGSARTLVAADADAIKKEVAGIRQMSPGLTTRAFLAAGNRRHFARVQGASADLADMYAWQFSSGAMFTADDLRGMTAKAVLGHNLAGKLFGEGIDPVGQTVTLRDVVYTVTGVMTSGADDHDDVLFVPWPVLQRDLGVAHLQTIVVAAERAGESSKVAGDITTLLRRRHRIGGSRQVGYLAQNAGVGGTPDDFTVKTQAAQALTRGLYTPAAAFALANLPRLDEVTLEEMADTLDQASDTMTALLASIAGVSLVVGGIGIMNIMLVSVTERTREIGVRMASGARASDVGLQFLVEAVTLSVIGGLAGLVLGLLAARLVGWSLGWPTEVSPAAMLLAVGISAAVGLLFGSYPARRAALLDPIDALRSE